MCTSGAVQEERDWLHSLPPPENHEGLNMLEKVGPRTTETVSPPPTRPPPLGYPRCMPAPSPPRAGACAPDALARARLRQSIGTVGAARQDINERHERRTKQLAEVIPPPPQPPPSSGAAAALPQCSAAQRESVDMRAGGSQSGPLGVPPSTAEYSAAPVSPSVSPWRPSRRGRPMGG